MNRPTETEYATYFQNYVGQVSESDIMAVLRSEIDDLDVLLNRVPPEKEAWAYAEGNLGVALVKLGRFGEAIPPLEHATQLLPMAMLHDQLGVAYANLGRIGDAEAEVSQGLRLEPSNVDLLVHQAQLLAARHRFQEAKAVLDRALALDPSNEMARRVLAQVHDSLSAAP